VWTRQCKNEARSFNHCFGGKAISITYSEYVFVASGIQHATHIRHILTCSLPGLQHISTFSH